MALRDTYRGPSAPDVLYPEWSPGLIRVQEAKEDCAKPSPISTATQESERVKTTPLKSPRRGF